AAWPNAIMHRLDPSDPRSPDHPCHREQWLELARSVGRALADQDWAAMDMKRKALSAEIVAKKMAPDKEGSPEPLDAAIISAPDRAESRMEELKMHYVVLIDGKPGAYGVVVPDFFGCTTMGKTIEEALANAIDAMT